MQFFSENNVLERLLEKGSLQVCVLVFLWNDRNASSVFMIFCYSLPQNKHLWQNSAVLVLNWGTETQDRPWFS